MRIHLAAATIAAASLLAVAACDSRDYEAEIATLEGDLQNARSENEQLQTQLSELQAQAEAEPATPEGALDTVQAQLNSVMQTAATTFERAGSISEEPDAPPEQRSEALSGVREDMQKIVQSVQAAAGDLGIELETVAMDTDADATEGTPQPEPAAGPAVPAPDEPATTPEEQPATEQEQPPASAQ